MKQLSVKALAKLSGVTVRTLHYYDKIGLLKPTNRTEAGYRYYSEQELLRLQQILFYKELDFPLKEITEILDNPDFDLVDSLKKHKVELKGRKARISKLLVTIDNTINHLKTRKVMSKPEILYDGLPKEMGTTYRKEAMDKYGKEKVEKAESELSKLGKDKFAQLKKESDQIYVDLFALRNEAPESEQVQAAIAKHYIIIRKFWGTHGQADKQAQAYAGLGHLYVNDERFTMVEGKPQAEYALFLKKAMAHFAEKSLKD